MAQGRRFLPWLLGLVGVLWGCAASDGSGFGVDQDGASRPDATDGAAADKADGAGMDAAEDAQREAGVDGARADAPGDADGGRVCAMTETCDNGQDDDCDGEVDERCACLPGATQRCYLAAPDTAGIGQCRYGMQRCDGTGEFGTWTPCEGAQGPGPELCDTVDNDCNGVVDDRCECRAGDMRGCYGGPAETRGIGACRDGAQLCFAGPGGVGSAWGMCTGGTTPAMETCDGVDNDCNGTVDDGCGCMAGESRRCYGGPEGTEGRGPCRAGTQRCVAGDGGRTAWGACEMQTLPAPERCDGEDNDCDGTVDDGCACRAGETRACYEGPMGTRGVAPCADGMQACVLGAGGIGSSWGPCLGQRLPSAELCDDVDNNCNRAVDDGCACRRGESRACYTGPMGTQGVGLCRAGSQSCNVAGGAASFGPCMGQTLPAMELCGDGVDNNCNGVVDDGCVCRAGESRACYAGPMGTQGVGVCRAGTQACTLVAGVASFGACMGQVGPSAEVCGDDLDNNCNGTVDDGCACRRGETRSCYAGPAGTAGRGICTAGTQTCAVTGGVAAFGPCVGEVTPQPERCDRVDNNCDGVVDDGCLCAIGATQACYTGPMSTRGVGLCREGSQACVAGPGGVGSAFGPCGGQVLPGAETCNGSDDNCDGRIDEGCSCTPGTSRACYGGPAGTQGVGICRAGTQSCTVTGGVAMYGPCVGEATPQPERCDRVDNDCDGVVDDGCACAPGTTQACYTGPTGTQGVGVCRAGSQTCVAGPGGVGSSWGACGGDRVPGPEVCDGADSDCDGMVDEGCACTPGSSRGCYTGPMATRGVGTCRDGTQMCVAGPGGVGSSYGACTGDRLPSAELCDGMDNDCNGMVDNGCVCTPGASEACYSGPTGTQGVGICRAGTRTCVAGAGGVGSAWGACTGETLPRAETCNMVDDNCNAMVDDGLSCTGPTVTCPAPVTAPAGTTVTLTAMATGAASYRWELVSGPRGGAVMFGSPTSASTTFTSVIVGVYTVRVTVTDASGRTATCNTTVTLQGHGLRVELVWDTGTMAPVTAGRTDLDLHLHNRSAGAWFDDPNDCFYANRTPRWDVRGSTADDPSLDLDNVYGFGPENIRVDSPVVSSQTYSVGVHFFFGDVRSTATVRIYCGEVLVGTFNRALNGGPILGSGNDFWRVARVVFSSPSMCAVTRVDDVVTFTQARTGNP